MTIVHDEMSINTASISAQGQQHDLDSILDDALDAFDEPEPNVSPHIPSSNKTDDDIIEEIAVLTRQKQQPQTTGQSSSSTSHDGSTVPSGNEEDAALALEDALRALGELGLDGHKGTTSTGQDNNEDVTEADMKLVEEFITSLGESLNGLGNIPGSAGLPTYFSNPVPSNEEEEEQPVVVEKLVESIVGHLLSEDVLKEPMLLMRQAYNEWLPKNETKLSENDLKRYKKQKSLVDQICEHYEKGAGVTEIMELLSFMQETGAPPDEVMNQLSRDGSMDGFLQRLGALDTNTKR